jgi:hypothetical protein
MRLLVWACSTGAPSTAALAAKRVKVRREMPEERKEKSVMVVVGS